MRIQGGGSPPSGHIWSETSFTEVPPHLLGAYVRIAKPLLDRILGVALLLVFAPLILLAALLILVSMGRPVFFSQDRIGIGGRRFRLHKLRTMIPDRRVNVASFPGVDRRMTHKSPDDPRVSPVGRVLRSMRVDELPQFWNVVKGDMSLVGPRPEIPEVVRSYEPWQHQRHVVKPGVTGPWQISHRNGKLMHECTELDIDYINQVSLLYDLRILAGTPRAMIGGRRGY
ncbi:MAG: sugar transferase [Actinobacteria bacterium]|nr:sugar transferase [Actinomycetota bacterium]